MKNVCTAVTILTVSALVIYLGGCSDEFLDPTQIGRFRPVPAVNIILDSLGVAEETSSPWEGAEDPRPADVIPYEVDYTFGSGDIVRVYIFELLREGQAFINDYIVTESGKISIPEAGIINAAGLTEAQLEEEIRQILSPSILKEPSVTVTLRESERRTFSISGEGVPRPSRYSVPRYNFRLLDALAIAGGVSQFNISYIYVSRSVTGKEAITEPIQTGLARPEEQKIAEPQKTKVPEQEEMEELIGLEQEMLEIIAPRAQRQFSANKLIITSTEMITDKELAEAALPEGFETVANDQQQSMETEDLLEDIKDILADAESMLESSKQSSGRETIDEPIESRQIERIEWIFQDGRWMPVQIGQQGPIEPTLKVEPRKAAEPLEERLPDDFGWEQVGTGGVQTRVIKIPADKLAGGDPRFNVIIKPGDSIQVPVDIIGEYFIYGNTNRQGAVPLTGRPLTLKMAVAAAGGLGPLAWPKRCEVTRRIGENKEETVMVDLDKIAKGEQPDFFIKPLDLINVGTHPTARWRAVLRNAFRATYGFGFLYDRNFADRDVLTSRPIPNWF